MTIRTSTAGEANLPRYFATVFDQARKSNTGRLDLELPDGRVFRAEAARPGPVAHVTIHNPDCFARLIREGDLGFCEAYVDGWWSTPDLQAFMDYVHADNDAVFDGFPGMGLVRAYERMRFWLNSNSKRQAKKNISYHYDLGNAFYRYWLDETMNYSSAWFQDDRTQSLPQAQHAKVRRALDEATVAEGDRVLEIGCGWGAVAHAAAQRGASVVGVTLSTEQLHYAQNRLDDAGYGARADLRLQDYRDIQDGPYDALISIEMFEAVGREYWPSFFETVRKNLKPGGRACIQSITIRDDLFDRYVKSTDFIQQYIFPGGMLPSEREFCNAAQRAGLRVENVLRFGPDYAETLRRWRAPFHANEPAIRAQGFDTVFMRTWDFYLSYCEAAFDTGNTNVVQFTLVNEAQEAA